jgi:hypothetical protein
MRFRLYISIGLLIVSTWLMLATSALSPGAPQQSTQPVRFEVRGSVLESETTAPVAGAEIAVSRRDSGPVLLNGGWNLDQSIKANADATGAFSITLTQEGSYRLEAKKPGFGPPANGTPNYAEFKLTREQPLAEVKLRLSGTGAIIGSVFDEETEKPVPNLQLWAVHARNYSGRFLPEDGIAARTGKDGSFVVKGLSTGEYAVEIIPQTERAKRVLTKFTEEDLKAVDLDYEHTYWPGGHGGDAAYPVTVGPGATVTVGTLHARKVPYYRVHVRIPASNCDSGDTMAVGEQIVRPGGGVMVGPSLAETPCGKDVLITGYERGSYRLLLSIDGRAPGNRGSASVPFVINDRNIEVLAPIQPSVSMDGVIVAAEAATPPDFSKLRVSLRGVDGLGSVGGDMQTPGDEGKFRFPDLRPLSHTVLISGLDSAHYVKEIRYNGIPLSRSIVPLDEPAMSRTLTVVVDDDVGVITGSVSSSDGPVSRPTVVAVRWPYDPALRALTAQGDPAGLFQINGVAPGEYRVIALKSAPQELAQELRGVTMAAFERLLSAGKKVEMSPGGMQNIALQITDLSTLQLGH